MNFRFYTILVVLFILQLGNLSALSLNEYLNDVKNNSVKIKIKENTQGKRKWENLQSYSGYLPSLSLGGAFYYDQNTEDLLNAPGAGTNPALVNTRNPIWTRNISLSLPIFIGGKRVFSNLIANKNKEIASVDVEYEKISVQASAVAAYFQAFVTQENILITEQALSTAQEDLNKAKLLLKVGKTTELVYLNFELTYKRRKQELQSYRLEMDKNILRMSIIASKEIAYEPLDAVDSSKIRDSFISNDSKEIFEKTKETMMQNSPLLIKMRKYKEIADYSQYMTLSELLPAFSFNYTHDFGMSQDHPFNTTFYQDNDTVTLSMNWNIFNGFYDAIEYKKADADTVASHLTYIDTRNEQIYSLRTIISTIYSLLDQLAIAQDAVIISQKTLAHT
ncbi:TolC family protein, partial [bacterium]|nr:TolC family protein [bacterium]